MSCTFSLAWRGPCGRGAGVVDQLAGVVDDAPRDRCPEHRAVKCRCGAPATRECDVAGSLVCGRPLCASCGCTCQSRSLW
jgi:hypothetical protein